MATPVRGATLGELYEFDGVDARLSAVAAGLPRTPRPEPQGAGTPKPLTAVTAEELTHARGAVAEMAREERLAAWPDDWAEEEGMFVESLLLERHMSLDRPADREALARPDG